VIDTVRLINAAITLLSRLTLSTVATRQCGSRSGVRTRAVARREQSGMAAAGIALGAFAVLFVLVRTKRSAATDAAITLRFQRHRHPVLSRTMDLVSWPGFPPQSRLLPPALVAGLWLKGLRVEAIFQALAWGTSGISFFFKSIMKRPRPYGSEFRIAVANIDGTSFPSGHVLNYVGVYGFLTYLVHTRIRPKPLRRILTCGLLSMLALVGPSRVYLGHHWFTDVLASYLLGTSYLIGITAVYRWVKRLLG
jgi:membrane-associated phospholipid phosphatase